MSKIITLSGKINCGKDEVYKMINFITNTMIYFDSNYATYEKYKANKDANISYATSICRKVSFGENLKKALSTIFSIKEEYFNDREHKDKLWYVPIHNEFVNPDELSDYAKKKYIRIDDTNIDSYYTWHSRYIYYTTLRSLMQRFSEHTKELFGKNIWAESLVTKINNDMRQIRFIVITDLRFEDELDAIAPYEPTCIYINRPNNDVITNHISETQIKDAGYEFTYTINNDGSLENLFNKVKNIINIEFYENSRTRG